MRPAQAPPSPPDESLLRLLEVEARAAAILRHADEEAAAIIAQARAEAQAITQRADAEQATGLAALETRIAAERGAALADLQRQTQQLPALPDAAGLDRLAGRVVEELLRRPTRAGGRQT